jgi:hypothetical protein
MIHLQADKHATENNTGTTRHRPVSPTVPESVASSPRTVQPPTEPLIRYAVLNLLRSNSMLLRVAIIWAALLQSSSAAPVTFGFRGHITSAKDKSNYLSGVTVGVPFTGTVTYDSAWTRPPSSSPSPHTEYYSFTNAPGLSFVVQVGAHTFTGAAQTPGQSGIIVYDNYDNVDSLSIWLNPSQILMDGSPQLASFSHGGLGLQLVDESQSVYSSDALPTARPEVAQFTRCRMNISASMAGVPETLYVTGNITQFTDTFEPQLAIRRLPNGDIQLAWPLAATGFTLESRDQLNSGNWEPVVQIAVATDTEYVVTLSATQAPRFFRLAKTN